MLRFRLTPEEPFLSRVPSRWTITQYPGTSAERSVHSFCHDEALHLCWMLCTEQVRTIPAVCRDQTDVAPSAIVPPIAVYVGRDVSCIFECDPNWRPVAFTGPLFANELLGGLASWIFAGRMMWGFKSYEQWHAMERRYRWYREPVAMLEQVVDTRLMMQGV